ncbi:alpha/beta fold hydrolase [Defluviimonas sp. SAOS-178_SWC]|uniref:alpha/beta fold hydrolase n=1 Tax=Defluviimonas sp. SAOS-178_SWC TaxID=3121287 RepID=UPI0032215F18
MNGIQLNLVDSGGDGPAVMFLHGFPDGWELWRHQMQALVSAGYRVIAYDQRGFGDSDKPQEVDAYLMQTLVADAVGVMEHAGVRKAHVICHDWGANVGWALASAHPDRVDRLVPISSGHPKFNRTIEGNEKSWYVFFFQFAGVAEEAMAANNFSLFRQLVRNHPESKHWIADLARPGALTAAMNWYRANYSPLNGFKLPMEVGRVKGPVLGIFGKNDVLLQEIRMLGSDKWVEGEWRYERVEEAGHWVPLDQPDHVNWLILDFLQ